MKALKLLYAFITRMLRDRVQRVQYILIVATLTGLISGLVAVLLKMMVHYLQVTISTIPVSKIAFLLFPTTGLILTVFIIRHFYGGHIERGIPMVLKSIARKFSVIPLSHTYKHVTTSAITVGLGGSVGLEAPIVATGSAIGSNVARVSELQNRERTLLIGCGAAAGIAAVFNAPIAGVIFAMEILLTGSVVSYFIPLILSAVTGALCSAIILKESFMFNFTLAENFNYHNVPFYILLGILTGFVSLYYARTFKRVEHFMVQRSLNPYLRALYGGLLLMGIYILLPSLFGEGYDHILRLSGNTESYRIADNTRFFSVFTEEWAMIIFTGLVVLLKPIAAGITIGSGGNGGNFAPSLFTGAFLGFFFSRLISSTGWFRLPDSNFSLVAMAGVLSGVMYCPLTAIFLIAEITNGYGLFIPLMIVSSMSYFIVKHYEPFSMELKQLAMSGEVFTHRKDQNVLSSIRILELLEEDRNVVDADVPVQSVRHNLMSQSLPVIAVADAGEKFLGIIELKMVEQQPDSTLARDIVQEVGADDIIFDDETTESIIRKFDVSKKWYLPVVNRKRKFIGFISQNKLFRKYRDIISEESDLYDIT